MSESTTAPTMAPTVSPYEENVYGSFDTGTSPNEIIKNDPNRPKTKLLFSENWNKWQNYYVAKKDESNKKLEATNWGEIDENIPAECKGIEDGIDLVHRYGETPDCGRKCNVNQSISLNNQGNIIGGVTLSNSSACLIGGDSELSKHLTDGILSRTFLFYMGSSECSSYNDMECLNSEDNKLCLGDDGDNCVNCVSDMCCLDPSLNNFNEYQIKQNININDSLGGKVSYICPKTNNTCLPGSKSLKSLEKSCGTDDMFCNQRNTVESCGSCQYCNWITDECSEVIIGGETRKYCKIPGENGLITCSSNIDCNGTPVCKSNCPSEWKESYVPTEEITPEPTEPIPVKDPPTNAPIDNGEDPDPDGNGGAVSASLFGKDMIVLKEDESNGINGFLISVSIIFSIAGFIFLLYLGKMRKRDGAKDVKWLFIFSLVFSIALIGFSMAGLFISDKEWVSLLTYISIVVFGITLGLFIGSAVKYNKLGHINNITEVIEIIENFGKRKRRRY